MTKVRAAEISVEVRYRGDPDDSLDTEIRKHARAWRGKPQGSGYIFSTRIRDMVFIFRRASDAYGFTKGLRLLKGGDSK